jgi:hypothetical protein
MPDTNRLQRRVWVDGNFALRIQELGVERFNAAGPRGQSSRKLASAKRIQTVTRGGNLVDTSMQ